jgi:hypothetical protein
MPDRNEPHACEPQKRPRVAREASVQQQMRIRRNQTRPKLATSKVASAGSSDFGPT